MPNEKFPVGIRFGAVDRISKVINKISNKFPKLARGVSRTSTAFKVLNARTERVRRTLKKVGNAMKGIGRKMTMGLTLPIVAMGTFALRAAGNFQAAMKDVQGKLGIKGTDAAMIKLGKTARWLGATTQFAANEAALAMANLAQNGLKAMEIFKASTPVINLAASTNIELAESARVSTKVMKGYSLGIERMVDVNNMMVKATNSAGFNIIELFEAMKEGGAIMAANDTPIQDTIALLGKLADVSFTGTRGGTALKMAMTSLMKPSKEAGAVFTKLKIPFSKVFDPATKKVRSLISILGLLNKAGASGADMITIFGKRAGPSLLPLLKMGEEKIRALSDTIMTGLSRKRLLELGLPELAKRAHTLGESARIAKLKMSGFNGMLLTVKSAVEAFGISLSNSGALEWFTDLGLKLANAFRWLSNLKPATLKWISIVAIAVAVIGPLVFALGSIIAAIPLLIVGWVAVAAVFSAFGISALKVTAIIAGVTAGIAGVIAITAFLIEKWETLKMVGKILWLTMTDSLTSLKNTLGSVWSAMKTDAGSFFDWLGGKMQSINAKLEGFISPLTNLVGRIFPSGQAAGVAGAGGVAQGAPIGATEISKTITQNQNTTSTNNAAVSVTFGNLPQGTRIESESEGPLELGGGMLGAL